MTRTEAITIITKSLEAIDDTALENAAAQLANKATFTDLTVEDIADAFATDSVLPRPLSSREIELVQQSKEDFRHGRTLTHDEAVARTDAFLAARRTSRAQS